MSKSTRIHVVPHPEGWAIRREGSDRASAVTPTKEQALDRAREIAQRHRGEVVVHGKDGQIQEGRSFGNDPFPPRG